MSYTYEYPRPSLTVDCIIFGLDESHQLKILLIQRGNAPFKDLWALPGGFVDMNEDLDTAALRELEEETGMRDVFIEQLYTFGKPGRDPRGRVISVAYYALVNLMQHPVQAASDARNVEWFDLNQLPDLAFDHQTILDMALRRLRGKMRYQPIGFELLPEKFTLTQLQQLYETILGVELNKRNFRKRILDINILKKEERQKNVAHRPAFLYSLDKEQYEKMVNERSETIVKRGFDFDS